MKRRSISAFIGLAGVADDENRKARHWGRIFELPMLLLALWIIIEWYLTASPQFNYPRDWETVTNWVILLFFLAETVILSGLVTETKRYLLTNWVNLLIIVVGIPLLWSDQPYAGALRSLRILLLLGLVFEISSTVRQVLARNNVGLTLLVSFIIIIMAGTTIAAIDPAVETPWEGIWWAWVTVTTAGYGDIVPESPPGRVFGGILMILGLGLFSLITASFSAFLISREEEEVIEKEKEIIEKEEAVMSEEKRVSARLENIEERLGNLEESITKLIDRLPK